jgi:hypothetical protein
VGRRTFPTIALLACSTTPTLESRDTEKAGWDLGSSSHRWDRMGSSHLCPF